MKLSTFRRMCRRAARKAPYHPERVMGAQTGNSETRSPNTFWPRVATVAGAALVTAVAVVITLFTPLFRDQSPTLLPGTSSGTGTSDPSAPSDILEETELLKLEPVWNYLYLIGDAYSAGDALNAQNMLMLLELVSSGAGSQDAFQDAMGDSQAQKRLGLGESPDPDGYNETGHRIYKKIALSDLNRIAENYFSGLRFSADDFPSQYTPDAQKTWQWLYDSETNSVYLAIGAIGFTEPYNRYVVCEKEQDGNRLHYQMVGVYTESEEIEELDTPETFADYQKSLSQLSISGDGTPCTLLDVTVKITDKGYAIEQATLTKDTGNGDIREQAMDRLLHSSLLEESLSAVQWTGTGSAAKLLELQDVLREFCTAASGKETLSPETMKEDPSGFLNSYFWLLVSLQERDSYVFSYDDPNYRDVVERFGLSVPMSAEEYGVTDTRFDLIYRFPLEELNSGIARYFQGFRFEPGDFSTDVPSDSSSETAFLYDAVTNCVYMPCTAIGREDPQPLLLICQEEQTEDGRLTYTMLGVETYEGDDFLLKEESDPTLNDSLRFGDFQQRLGEFAEANPERILYSVRVTVDITGEHYTIVSLETTALDSKNPSDQQTVEKYLGASHDLRAANARATVVP